MFKKTVGDTFCYFRVCTTLVHCSLKVLIQKHLDVVLNCFCILGIEFQDLRTSLSPVHLLPTLQLLLSLFYGLWPGLIEYQFTLSTKGHKVRLFSCFRGIDQHLKPFKVYPPLFHKNGPFDTFHNKLQMTFSELMYSRHSRSTQNLT